MSIFTDMAFLAGLVLLPAAGIVFGGLLLGWLERFAPDKAIPRRGLGATLAAIPFAALVAAMVLAPVVVAVWAVMAEEEAVAYLATVGFALGAMVLSLLAGGAEAAGLGLRWPRMPGVLLTSAIGFFIALVSFLGNAVARSIGARLNDTWRIALPLAVAVVIGGLGLAAYRARTAPERGGGDDDAAKLADVSAQSE